ncbi:MAG: DUF5678 domain-containing protein [Candidatus Binataceae bacterium]
MPVEQIHTVRNIVCLGIAALPVNVGATGSSAHESLGSGFTSFVDKASFDSQGTASLVSSLGSATKSNGFSAKNFGSGVSVCSSEPVAPSAPRSSTTGGHRSRELNFCAEHPEAFAKLVGQWVALEGETIVASGFALAPVMAEARKRGIKVPFVFRVEPPSDESRGNLGI